MSSDRRCYFDTYTKKFCLSCLQFMFTRKITISCYRSVGFFLWYELLFICTYCYGIHKGRTKDKNTFFGLPTSSSTSSSSTTRKSTRRTSSTKRRSTRTMSATWRIRCSLIGVRCLGSKCSRKSIEGGISHIPRRYFFEQRCDFFEKGILHSQHNCKRQNFIKI